MQPIISLFAPLGLLIYSLSLRRNILHFYKRPHFHEGTLNAAVNWMLRGEILAFGFGHLTVNNFISYETHNTNNGTLAPNWIMVGIGVIWSIVLALRRHCFFEKADFGNWDY